VDGNIVYVMMNLIPVIIICFIVLLHVEENKTGSIICVIQVNFHALGSLPMEVTGLNFRQP
jgi:hypothetical protein